MRTIFHIDVNSAYLSWTSVENLKTGNGPDLREIPAIIGGDQKTRHGVVLAKSIPAKKFGIHTGEPVVNALKKCPNLIMAPPNHDLYHAYSRRMMDFLHSLTPDIEQVSIDECFLDFTGISHRYPSPYAAARYIKDEIHSRFGFTVNVGISSNKLLAKMASDFEKPDKVHTLYEEEIPSKMWALPVSELFMLGKKTIPKLYAMGIKTIGDLAKQDKEYMIKIFGKHGLLMWEYSNGIDNSEVKYIQEKPKGIGNSVTLPIDVREKVALEKVILTLVEQVAYRLRKYNMYANVVNVQLRTSEFKDFSHQKKLSSSTANTKDIYNTAKELLNEMYKNGTPIRLVGVRVDNLVEKGEVQISLFGNTENEKKQEKLDSVVDQLKQKYGYNSITRAGKLHSEDVIKLKDV